MIRVTAFLMERTALLKMFPLGFVSLPFFLWYFRYFLGTFLPPVRLERRFWSECGDGRSFTVNLGAAN